MKILVTGSAGFIGFHLVKRLLTDGHDVIGVDNLNDYYAVSLKEDRLAEITKFCIDQNVIEQYDFQKIDIANSDEMNQLFDEHNFDMVVNLAAQAGVRYSIENPKAYIEANISGFLNVLECCKKAAVKHLVYASSSSVYGMNTKQPFSTDDRVDNPISLYAATKKSNELMAHTYSHLFNLPTTGLRFFTVYGPWGRPDMAYFKFTKAILSGEPIDVYNNGIMQRDFTYIDDIVDGITKVLGKVPQAQQSELTTSVAPYKVFNIGNNKPVTLRRFITAIEDSLGVKAKENLMPMQPGDVPVTYADIDDLVTKIGFEPKTSIEVGLNNFVVWYRAYFGSK